jgi:hypothetical protein
MFLFMLNFVVYILKASVDRKWKRWTRIRAGHKILCLLYAVLAVPRFCPRWIENKLKLLFEANVCTLVL